MARTLWEKLTGWKECPTCGIPVKFVGDIMFDKKKKKHAHVLSPLMRDHFKVRGGQTVIIDEEEHFMDSYPLSIGADFVDTPSIPSLEDTTAFPTPDITPDTPVVETFAGSGGFGGAGGGSSWGDSDSSSGGSSSSDSSYDSGGSSYSDSGGSSDSGGGGD